MSKIPIILLALLFDLTLGEPPNRFHPVVAMGKWLTKGRHLAPKRHRFWFGLGWIVTGLALFSLPWSILKARQRKQQTPSPPQTIDPIPNTLRDYETTRLLEKPGKLLCFSTPHSGLGMKGQNPGFIISSIRLFFKKNPIERFGLICQTRSPLTLGGGVSRTTNYTLRPTPQALGPIKTFTRHILIPALLLKPVFAYRNLRQSVLAVAQALSNNNLPEARRLTGWHLVSRDTSQLTAAEVGGAAIESLAENITDSVTAPLMAFSLGGLPAAWSYRFVNTADAMWGYRNEEFEQLGKFPAKLDDALNWLPARLTGWLLVIATHLAGENALQAQHTMLNQHNKTSSPNAGWTISAMAGALDISLNKRNAYNLAGGQTPITANTIQRAIRVADICLVLSIGVILLLSIFRPKSI